MNTKVDYAPSGVGYIPLHVRQMLWLLYMQRFKKKLTTKTAWGRNEINKKMDELFEELTEGDAI